MPIYEYECLKCKVKFEVFQNKYKEKEICPKCKNTNAHVIPSIPNFKINGFNAENNYGLK